MIDLGRLPDPPLPPARFGVPAMCAWVGLWGPLAAYVGALDPHVFGLALFFTIGPLVLPAALRGVHRRRRAGGSGRGHALAAALFSGLWLIFFLAAFSRVLAP